MERPLLAITMGDPAGVGPETVVGAWSASGVHDNCRPFVVGHAEILRRAARLLKSPLEKAALEIIEIDSPEQADPSAARIPCLTVCGDACLAAPPATIDPRGGQAAYEALVAAARLALDGRVDAITTGPLHKAALWQAGHHYPGHTELLAELCGVSDYAMMLYLGPGRIVRGPAGLAIVHVTLHTALRDVFAQLTPEAILVKARLVHDVMGQLKRAAPKIGVCALNPHAGEEGLFGDEERTIIAPAVERGRQEGLDLTGPLPSDTLIARARDGEFDAVVAMYHDQGHIAIKLLAMHQAVNVTLGLPIVRTSVAHGTAFDRAWQAANGIGTNGIETTGMVEAIRTASLLARARKAAR